MCIHQKIRRTPITHNDFSIGSSCQLRGRNSLPYHSFFQKFHPPISPPPFSLIAARHRPSIATKMQKKILQHQSVRNSSETPRRSHGRVVMVRPLVMVSCLLLGVCGVIFLCYLSNERSVLGVISRSARWREGFSFSFRIEAKEKRAALQKPAAP
jgi:hypothetical protein